MAVQAAALLGVRTDAPRRARRARLSDPKSGELLDRGLSLFFPRPSSVTGEDLVELHVHGGRAVVSGVLGALAAIDGLREARPGEFTYQAFLNGKIDLTEVEGLGDLLLAETAGQRRQALRIAEGGLSREVDRWRRLILTFAAQVEAALDYADEDIAIQDDRHIRDAIAAAAGELATVVEKPPAERLRDGVRIVLAGPPNAGKSSLFNALLGRGAALVSDVPGTTRDVIEASVQWDGIPLLLSDTAGLRSGADRLESMGIDRALATIEGADIILWLGAAELKPDHDLVIQVHAKADLDTNWTCSGLPVSALTGLGIDDLKVTIAKAAATRLPVSNDVALNGRQRDLLAECGRHLDQAARHSDLVLLAEELRSALRAIDRITLQASTDDMLTAMFASFCLGK